ncbi:MAG: hypothetical protein ACP5PT_00875 [Brevinematia bacterium]
MGFYKGIQKAADIAKGTKKITSQQLLKSAEQVKQILEKYKIPIGVAIAGGAGYEAYKILNGDNTTSSTSTPIQTDKTTPPKITTAPKKSSSSGMSKADADVNFLMKNLFAVNQIAEENKNKYELATQKYLEANEVYDKQLSDILPVMTLFAAKTSLNDITTEDLPKIVGDHLRNLPYTAGIGTLDKVIKGYYALKLNGVDTQNLSPTDLIEAADNPAFITNFNENMLKTLDITAKTIQLKMKQNLDTIGILRDNFKAVRDDLDKRADNLKQLLQLMLQEKFNEQRLNIEKEKLSIMREKNAQGQGSNNLSLLNGNMDWSSLISDNSNQR